MSKIRFRVWDKVNKKWNHELSIDGDGNFEYIENGQYELAVQTRYEALLSTNTKDKNGVEIYEGDIVEDDNNIDVFEVIRRGGVFYLRNHRRYSEALIYVGVNSFATKLKIGNIYENPELLIPEPKLKPCPFCGGDANFWNSYNGLIQIRCNNCDARSRPLYDKENLEHNKRTLVKEWSRRANES